MTRIGQKKWSSAESSLRKAIKKDTLNAQAKYIYARYYLATGNPEFNIDSSYAFTQKALRAWGQSSLKQKERLQKLQVDSTVILAFRSRVDSAAFERAGVENTLKSYEYFIGRFPFAAETSKAIELRDELAYVEALRVNTAEAFRLYVANFPSSRRVEDASERYEQLIFKERTRSGALSDYKTFLADFPTNAFRDDAERFVFDISTSSGLIDDYLTFITQYPSGSQSAKARNILYYLMRESGRPRPAWLDNDSLRMLDERNKGYWVPFYKNGLYGFMNDDGTEVMSPQFESIDSSYLCGELTRDFLVTSSGVYSRGGALLLKKTSIQATDLGRGFLKIADGSCNIVVHQSGFQVGDNCVEDARIVAEQFIALKKKDGWYLYAFNGRQLITTPYEDISNVDKLVVLKRYGKSIVVRAQQIAAIAQMKQLDISLVFDDVRAWGEGNLLVKNGVLEGVIGQDIQFVIPLGRQVLVKTSFGFISRKDGKVQVTGVLPALEAESYDDVRDYGDWLELRSGPQSTLYRVSLKKIVADKLDSVWMKNRVAFAARNDSLNVYAGASKLASFERTSPVNFIRGGDSVVYFWVPEKKNKVVFEASHGKKLFSADFEDIEVIAGDLFAFSKKNRKGVLKKGIFRRDGKIAQPAEYDVIVPSSAGYLSLLKDKKFGLYDIKQQKLIKPEYERNVLPYAGGYFIAYKGAYGIITAAEEPITGFDFDEIRYWNDTSAWVKKNFAWTIISIKNKENMLSRIRSFQTIKDTGGERIVRVQQDNYFGIVSNRRGVLIPPTFTDILNIGSSEKPFYFTEKRVEEAGIYVVIYYNSEGKLVRKQVYEEEEYDRIYCEN
ncbi:MAG TPA: WG repeat-containing protein [Cyclobacteriaceae bacterium]|nr:WG repeat-containing protein [Cyclobacteriaceae bacterium]